MPIQLRAAMWCSYALRAMAIIVAALVPMAFAQAQTVPDAGTLNQQIERERVTPLPRVAPPLAPVETAPLKLPEGAKVTARAFRLIGNRLLDDARLQPVLQAYLDRPLDFTELQRAAQAVANAYRDAGWNVRTYLPRQDVTDGLVTIQVIEAVFSGARLETPQGALTRVRPDQVLATVAAQQKSDEPLSTSALDRALLLADDLPGVSASGSLEAGRQDGETGLVLQVRDEPPATAEVTLDNHGARSTGEWRAVATATLASPLRLGDLLRSDMLRSDGSDYGRLAWGLPVPGRLGADGWRVGVNTSRMNYRLVADEFAALHGKGSSSSNGVEVSYPVIRSRMHNVYATFSHDDKRFHNEANGITQSHYGVASSTWGLSSNVYDKLGGGGANSFALAWQDGRVRQGRADPGENTALDGRWSKLRYSVSRLQVLSPGWSLMAAASGQHASRDVDSSERFYLGGPQGVRAYPVNEGGGSNGQALDLELRWRASPTLTVAGFYDAGRVSGDGQPGRTYKGGGASVTWSAPQGVDVKLTWAHRDGANPNPTATGRDQDGSLTRNRVWVQASLAF